MQGLGNNYIYLNCMASVPDNLPELARNVSNINYGIGSDGLILILPSKIADFRMQMFNADGSEAEMCGNGIRCVGKYIKDKGLSNKTELTIETKAGTRELRLLSDTRIKVNMGKPIFEPEKIPVKLDAKEIINYPYNFFGHDFHINCISVGNPHCVIFVPEITDELVLKLGPQIEKHPVFPNRINIEFAKVNSPSDITMRVWERGSGETFACGTGACAVAVAQTKCQTLSSSSTQTIHLLGGDLEIEYSKNQEVFMTGPAEFVCDGEFFINSSDNR